MTLLDGLSAGCLLFIAVMSAVNGEYYMFAVCGFLAALYCEGEKR